VLQCRHAGRPILRLIAGNPASAQEACPVLWTIIGILLLLWIIGVALNVAGGLIHVLLILAVLVLGYELLTSRRAT
jgi:hypothetical protein